ncbi:hypothetical protein E2C01_042860 [Portunus trituberculatus]|uniref:Uncharacterized protein n=1 Tax=Portunus trituberculatus TaxID=210409 RepID=A0A5B7FMW0_PORTR|nr:hypothetical protein [Portunus trituberculatus]
MHIKGIGIKRRGQCYRLEFAEGEERQDREVLDPAAARKVSWNTALENEANEFQEDEIEALLDGRE